MTRAEEALAVVCSNGISKAGEDCPRCGEEMIRHAVGVECLNPDCGYSRDGHISHEELQQADGWRVFDKDS